MMDSVMTVKPKSYERLGLFMKQRGFKQKTIAEKAGLTEYQLSRILTGKQVLSADDLEDLASAMETDPTEILATKQAA